MRNSEKLAIRTFVNITPKHGGQKAPIMMPSRYNLLSQILQSKREKSQLSSFDLIHPRGDVLSSS